MTRKMKSCNKRTIAVILAAFPVFLACSTARQGPKPDTLPKRADSVAKPTEQAPEDRFVQFVRKLDESIKQHRSDFFDESFDVEALVDRALTPLTVDRGNTVALKRSAAQVTSIGKKILADIEENSAKYSFLRLHEKNGEKRALFRITSRSGINYHDLILERGGPNGVRIVDIYIYISGELFSETVRRLYSLMLVKDSELQSLDKRGGGLLAQNIAVIKAMQEALKRHKLNLVLELYSELPEELQKEKVFLLQRLSAACALGRDAEQDAAIEAFEEAYPNDPALPLITMGYYSSRQRWDEVIKMIDALDAVVEDPYLDVMRATALIQKRELKEAEKLALTALERDGEIEDAYWVLVTVRLNTRDHEGVAQALNLLRKKFAVEFEDLESLEPYSEFVKSEAYRAWKLGL